MKPDLPPPQRFSERVEGWSFNLYSLHSGYGNAVFKSWSTSITNGTGHGQTGYCGGSQGSRHQYSTPALAKAGLRAAFVEWSQDILDKLDKSS